MSLISGLVSSLAMRPALTTATAYEHVHYEFDQPVGEGCY